MTQLKRKTQDEIAAAWSLPGDMKSLWGQISRLLDAARNDHRIDFYTEKELLPRYPQSITAECGSRKIVITVSTWGEEGQAECFDAAGCDRDTEEDHEVVIGTVGDLVRQIVWLADGARPVEDRESWIEGVA